MRRKVIYVHGKGGSAEEAGHYKPLFPGYEVIGLDYRAENLWEAAEEFPAFFAAQRKGCMELVLAANSIGAFFSLMSLNEKWVDRAYFISPVVDMEKRIEKMMRWANVTERELEEKREIPTEFGETLSWKTLCFVREHPPVWRVPTKILYGEKDHLTDRETIVDFAKRTGAALAVMPGGEHWFHTEEQMRFLDDWILRSEKEHFMEKREETWKKE